MPLPHSEIESWPEPPVLPSRLLVPLRHSRLDMSEPAVDVGQRVRAGDPLSRPLGLAAREIQAPLDGRVGRVAVLPVVQATRRDGSPDGPQPVPCVELVDLALPAPREETEWRHWDRPRLLSALRPWGLASCAGLPLDLELELLPAEARLLILGVAPAQALQDCLLEQAAERLAAALTVLCRVRSFREALLVAPPGHQPALRRLTALLEQVLPLRTHILRQGHPWDQPRLAALAAGCPLPSPSAPLASQGLLALSLDQLATLESRLTQGLALPPLLCQLDELRLVHGLPQPVSSRLIQVWPGTCLEEADPRLARDGEWRVAGSPLEGSPWLEQGLPILPGCSLFSLLPRTRRREAEEACIHCGQCLDICPMRLAPIRLVRLVEQERLDEARQLGLEQCVHCGLCSWICPSRIELEDGLRQGRQQLRRIRHGG